jgi:Tfp pilus assembly protein PilO
VLQGRRGVLVFIAAAVAVALLLILFLVLPKRGQVSSAKQDLDAAKAEQTTLETQLAALEQAEAAAPEARATIQQVDQQIPPTLDESGMLLLIKNAAVRSSIVGTTLTVGTPTFDAATGLSTVPVTIAAEGTYFSLTEFLYSLETLPRAAKVLNVTLSPAGEATTTTVNTLSMQANLEMFTSDASAGPGSVPGPTEAGG